MTYSYPGMIGYIANHEIAKFALENVYTPEIAKAHKKCEIHLHDLGQGICNYCLGLDFEMFLQKGLDDIDGAPKHFDSAMMMLMNAVYLIAQEIAGAVAFNSVDTLLAPYIKKDGLTYKKVRQVIQIWVYSICVKGRVGHQSPFTNIQLDLETPKRLKGRRAMVGNECMDFTYDDCEPEAKMFAQALLDVMLEAKRVLPFPVINMGITKGFDWEDESEFSEILFRTIGEKGQPTLNNYVNSNYDPDAVKSMCCSLRLDMREIVKQSGGQFGASDNSGSLGVVTLALPLYGYLAEGNKDILFAYVEKYLVMAKEALVVKRLFVEDMHNKEMFPTVKRFIGDNYKSFFNTIGLIGMNEMCLNFNNKPISDPESIALCEEVADYCNERLGDFQEEYKDFYGKNQGLLFNLELVPGEGLTMRFALHHKRRYPDIITANGSDGCYYTRGCWLPADEEFALAYATKHQEKLQDKFSGGANFQHFINEPINNWRAVRSLVKKLITNTTLPFISISPTLTVCPVCGVLQTTEEYCQHDLTEDQIADLTKKGINLIED